MFGKTFTPMKYSNMAYPLLVVDQMEEVMRIVLSKRAVQHGLTGFAKKGNMRHFVSVATQNKII